MVMGGLAIGHSDGTSRFLRKNRRPFAQRVFKRDEFQLVEHA
jgi:hypothetical protein